MDEDEERKGTYSRRSTERMLALSDGVFAFALTLLALNIQLPAGLTPPEFYKDLLRLLPRFASYVISFVLIGIYWMAHQRVYRFIKCYDHKLLWLNLIYLMSITFVPPLTVMLRDYGNMSLPVIMYMGGLLMSSLLLVISLRYAASKRELVTHDLDKTIIGYYTQRSLTTGLYLVLAIVIAFFSPIAAQYVLLFLLLVFSWFDRIRRPPRA